MSVVFSTWILVLMISVLTFSCTPGKCQQEALFRKKKGKHLANYVIQTNKTGSESECATHCTRNKACASVNYKISGTSKGLCELNNKTLDGIALDAITDSPEYNHLYIIKRIDPKEKQLEKTTVQSCQDLLSRNKSSPNGLYTLQANITSSPYKVYCHMTEIPGCGGGGWTLILKVDGNKNTFEYNSPLWTNKESYAVEDGLEGLSKKESKLASYWNTPFKKICLGMTINSERKWMVLNYEASSLHSVIADEKYQKISFSRNSIISLITGSHLQPNCNQTGFNIDLKSPSTDVYMKLRIGMVANNEDNCHTCDSWIGLGAEYNGCGTKVMMSSGNRVVCAADAHEIVEIHAFGYILAQ